MAQSIIMSEYSREVICDHFMARCKRQRKKEVVTLHKTPHPEELPLLNYVMPENKTLTGRPLEDIKDPNFTIPVSYVQN